MAGHLYHQIGRIVKETGIRHAAISFYDYETNTAWSYRGDVLIHAASTVKVAIMMGVFALVEDGVLGLDSRVPVKNSFLSVVDQSPYAIEPSRDSCAAVYASLGQSMPVAELIYHMIVSSSNLATNLLIDLAGVSALQEHLHSLDIAGVELKRGVEDELAFAQGINNLISANGLSGLFQHIYKSLDSSPESAGKMLRILSEQKFNEGIPMGVPGVLRIHTRFAHKTGDISAAEHDAGLVFLPDRKPYSLAILTERTPGKSDSNMAIQRLSGLVYSHFVHAGAGIMHDDEV